MTDNKQLVERRVGPMTDNRQLTKRLREEAKRGAISGPKTVEAISEAVDTIERLEEEHEDAIKQRNNDYRRFTEAKDALATVEKAAIEAQDKLATLEQERERDAAVLEGLRTELRGIARQESTIRKSEKPYPAHMYIKCEGGYLSVMSPGDWIDFDGTVHYVPAEAVKAALQHAQEQAGKDA